MISSLVFSSSGPLVPLMFCRHLLTSHVRPQTIVCRGGVLDQLPEGADIFVSGVRNIQAGRREVKLVCRHGFRCFHYVLLVLTYLAVD